MLIKVNDNKFLCVYIQVKAVCTTEKSKDLLHNSHSKKFYFELLFEF